MLQPAGAIVVLPEFGSACPVHGDALARTDAKSAGPVRRKGGKVARRGIVAINLAGPETDYFADLTKITDAAEAAIRKSLSGNLASLLPEDPDEDEAKRAAQQNKALSQIERSVRLAQRKISALESRAAKVASSNFDSTQRVHKTQQAAQLDQVGVDVFKETPELLRVAKGFVSVNTRLIKSIPADELDRVESILVDAIKRGRRHESVAQDIAAEFGIAENRARFIARDQIGKANADLSRHRMESNGVERAVWRVISPGEARVRSSHAIREGRAYKISKGLDGVRPGEEPNCRCGAEPLL